MGYSRAGFEVVGVDIKPQPNYPFEFFRTDAFEVLWDFKAYGVWKRLRARDFDGIHASPPCQAYVRSGLVSADGRHPDLLGPVRANLEQIGLPWVIENVPGAPMRADALLCGSQFDLPIRRHRLFEFSWNEPVMLFACDHSRPITGVYGHPHGAAGAADGMLPGNLETWSAALGIDWMTTSELADAIPPAYTQFIGYQLLKHIEVVIAA